MSYDKSVFAKNLNHQLAIHNMTQADLSRYLELSPTAVNKYCLGLKLPRLDNVQKIADKFGIKPSELLGLESKEDNDVFAPIQQALSLLMDDEIQVTYAGEILDSKTRLLIMSQLNSVADIVKINLK